MAPCNSEKINPYISTPKTPKIIHLGFKRQGRIKKSKRVISWLGLRKQKQANKEAEAKSQKQIKIAPLSGFINKQLPKRMIEASRKILGKEFTEDIGEIKESRIELGFSNH